MSIAAACLGALAFVPELSHYAAVFAALAGVLGGGAHIQRPGDSKPSE